MIGGSGVVRQLTTLHVSTAEVTAPYSVGLVQLEEGPVIFTLLEGVEGPGTAVHLTATADRARYWWTNSEHRKEG